MLNRILLVLAAAITISAAAFSPANAMNISSAARSIHVALPVQTAELGERATFSKRLFCLQYGSECRTSSRDVVAYTNKLRTVMASVNRSINTTMPEVRGRHAFPMLGSLPGRGDDYAMLKRSRLIRAGVPAGALQLASVLSSEGRAHAILIVKTSKGEFVLDHRTQSVVKRSETADRVAALTDIRTFD